MTPDLQARIETLARECAKSTITLYKPNIDEMRWAIEPFMSRLATSIIAEKDAESADLPTLGWFVDHNSAEYSGYVFSCQGDAEDFVNSLDLDAADEPTIVELVARPTAGRETLAELVQLRERDKEITAGTAELRRYVEGNGFTWQEDETTVFNVTTALGWLGGTVGTLRERVRELEGWLQDHARNSEGNNH